MIVDSGHTTVNKKKKNNKKEREREKKILAVVIVEGLNCLYRDCQQNDKFQTQYDNI